MTTRVRFAPAPTGFLHLGSARTALFNWLFARHTGGDLVLRIEDTNAELATAEHVDSIISSLEWLGLGWDGAPVRQSTRADLYQDAIETCIAAGCAYRCDCTRADLEARVGSAAAHGYDGYCRDRDVADGEGVAVRFRVPDEGVTAFDDVVRGHVEFAHAELEDFVIRRGDGTPTFIVANAVDDADLGITHVIRGEDLLNPTPRILLVRDALGAGDPPVFAHLPLIVNEARKKLSKRRDDVSLTSYRDQGVLAEAMVNYLALLGWGPPDDVEVRPIGEIVELFELADINPAPAMFDVKKLHAINGAYIRGLDVQDLATRLAPHLAEATWAEGLAPGDVAPALPLVAERARLLSEIPDQIEFLFTVPDTDPEAWDKVMSTPDATPIVEAARARFTDAEWSSDVLHAALREIGEGRDLKLGKAQAPVRVAVTGRTVGPPLFESLELLGRTESLRRLDVALDRLRTGT